MTLETTAANEIKKAAEKTARITESGVRKAWSILDAASDKQRPSEVLSNQAIRAIQGNPSPGE